MPTSLPSLAPVALDDLAQTVASTLGPLLKTSRIALGELTIEVAAADYSAA